MDISKHKELDAWGFIFLSANIDTAKEAARFGINADHAANYHADSKGTFMIYETMCEAIRHVRQCTAPLSADWKQSIEKDYKNRIK